MRRAASDLLPPAYRKPSANIENPWSPGRVVTWRTPYSSNRGIVGSYWENLSDRPGRANFDRSPAASFSTPSLVEHCPKEARWSLDAIQGIALGEPGVSLFEKGIS